MAPYQATIAYDGTDFFGFQRQKNEITIQSEIENALRKIGWTEKSILTAGRTDTGVHAEGQVIKFELDWHHKNIDLMRALNSKLPLTISVKNVKIAEEGFHPRFSAKERWYRYQVVFLPDRNPFFERYYWRVWPKPDKLLLMAGAQKISGTHDFYTLGRSPLKGGSTVRTVISSDWQFAGKNEAIFRIKAGSFLYHMVRRTVFLLMLVGLGKLDAVDLEKNIIEKKELPPGIAPANGLFLEKVVY
jgi:tRNA pseudouridine38-40 synthase